MSKTTIQEIHLMQVWFHMTAKYYLDGHKSMTIAQPDIKKKCSKHLMIC